MNKKISFEVVGGKIDVKIVSMLPDDIHKKGIKCLNNKCTKTPCVLVYYSYACHGVGRSPCSAGVVYKTVGKFYLCLNCLSTHNLGYINTDRVRQLVCVLLNVPQTIYNIPLDGCQKLMREYIGREYGRTMWIGMYNKDKIKPRW